ncbi:MAG: response regulator [Chloroflexi bacterium]|nr:response regulator [Chloroflexota bacterium]MCI0578639.1 response regulator [Chloroflexota bacterium]MCI0647212.1 response regulator [Chloroflexota bacterium]MCI0728938.1 response regulator [Chloroflexota bacterium]
MTDDSLERNYKLVGAIAHDVNNLLTSALLQAGLALNQLPADSPWLAHVQRAHLATQYAAGLMRHLMVYARGEVGVRESVDLNQLIQNSVQVLEAVLPAGVRLYQDLRPDLPPIKVYYDQVEHLILNLLMNAIEAMQGKQGLVIIGTGCGLVRPGELAGWWVDGTPAAGVSFVFLQVSDPGCGIDQATLQQIFEANFSTKGKGRGLGLSATLEIVRLHKGHIAIKSGKDIGTTVRVFFPVERPLPYFDQQINGTILVIDREALVREGLQDMLGLVGLRVLTAGTEAEAVDLFRRHHREIDAVILDIGAPKENGREIAAMLRSINPGVKIIVATTYAREEARQQLNEENVVAFLQKPYDPDALIARLKTLLP